MTAKPSTATSMPTKPAAASLDPDELAHLEEQRDFLLRSLADLDREHDAGDLDDADYEHLRDDYTARAAETIRAVDERRAAFSANVRPPDRKRKLLWVGAVALFAVVAGVAVAASLGARQPGGTSSGGIKVTQTASQQANACIPLIDQSGAAIKLATTCFQKVLAKDGDNAVALTWFGWQLSLGAPHYPGNSGKALALAAAGYLNKAVRSDPDYSYARAFRAVVAFRNGDAAAAKRYLADFRSHDPSDDAEAIIKQENLDANIEALAAVDSTTTTTTTQPR